MLDPLEDIKQLIVDNLPDELNDLPEKDSIISRISVQIPKNTDHGHMATNAAMILAKPLSSNPMDIARSLSNKLANNTDIESATEAKPGFVNIKFKCHFWHKVLRQIIDSDNYGRNSIGQDKRINLEFVSANPTGPLHIGHARNAIIGESLASILSSSGYKVHKEYYVNDAGNQITNLTISVLFYMINDLNDLEREWTYAILNKCNISIPTEKEDLPYKGDYLEDIEHKDIACEIHKHFITSTLNTFSYDERMDADINENAYDLKHKITSITAEHPYEDRLKIEEENIAKRRNFAAHLLFYYIKNLSKDSQDILRTKLKESDINIPHNTDEFIYNEKHVEKVAENIFSDRTVYTLNIFQYILHSITPFLEEGTKYLDDNIPDPAHIPNRAIKCVRRNVLEHLSNACVSYTMQK